MKNKNLLKRVAKLERTLNHDEEFEEICKVSRMVAAMLDELENGNRSISQ